MIRDLVTADRSYRDNADYDVAAGGPLSLLSDGHNSNSYAAGILKAARLTAPKLPSNIAALGYTKPLPIPHPPTIGHLDSAAPVAAAAVVATKVAKSSSAKPPSC